MSTKRYKAEQIVTVLRQIEVEIANGKTIPQACREAQITAQTYYRWRKEYSGLKLSQAKRLRGSGEACGWWRAYRLAPPSARFPRRDRTSCDRS